ncbi:MAG: DNA helicase [Myxococcales bacterium]|nr:DNA helicase [Myxococcales bacterium]
MGKKPNLKQLAAKAVVTDQYKKQLNRVKSSGAETNCIEDAVKDVLRNLPAAASNALVIYGDPQSGKTEMMICLTARLLDEGSKLIIHLLNDSIDLLTQSLDRFRDAGLAPAPRDASELADSPIPTGQRAILFCKKNTHDLSKLINALSAAGPRIVIDDEADFATPNSKVNKQQQTKINELVGNLIGTNGKYIGVTATPARLNLNNTFNNKTETWVQFRAHSAYTGQDHFFPQSGQVPYRLEKLTKPATQEDAQQALARFLVTVAYLNTTATAKAGEKNYTLLVHTSGKKDDHAADRKAIEALMNALMAGSGNAFDALLETIYAEARTLYPRADASTLTSYVVANASRSAVIVLNSNRVRAATGATPTTPKCPFTVIIGGNIVSRGVTFPNLLAMYFTRDVANKLQQDTYIQRARMFGARGPYLKHFELTIPAALYDDWHRCFVFHRLALEAIKNNQESPVWVGDPRISIASPSSIDRQTVNFDKGEMSFQIFDFPDAQKFDDIVSADPTSIATLKKLATAIEEGMPPYLIKYIDAALKKDPGTLAIHTASSIAKYTSGPDVDVDAISRTKGFIGNPQLEPTKFPNAIHHVKIFHNGKGKARVFYKNRRRVHFVKNMK